MNVSVQLHTILQRRTPNGPLNRLEIKLPADSTLADLLQELSVEMEPDALLLVVNGRMADPEQRLQDGDFVNLMPAISGG
jgi:sulfur carrier protein ThiS